MTSFTDYNKKLFFNPKFFNININVGDYITISYIDITNKLRIVDGLVISRKGKIFCEKIMIKAKIGLFGFAQNFYLCSPSIINIKKNASVKIRRARLYFTRLLSNKKMRAKFSKKYY